MRAAVVTVGNELLSGETINTNAAWLGRELTERGVSVERTTVVPDRIADIARVVNEYHAEYDAVLVTGGLGPTHDDVTMEGVAAAFGRNLEASEAVRVYLTREGGYAREDLVEGTTHIPAGARPLHNGEGVAPGCVIRSAYVLPGVPEEMKAMFEAVATEFEVEGGATHVLTVETPEPESALLGRIQDVRERFDVTVGSYPGGTVRIRIRGSDEETVEKAAQWFCERVETVDGENES